MTDPQPEPRELTRLREQAERDEKRWARSKQRCDRAQQEEGDARAAMLGSRNRVAAWLEANPQPQIEMAI